MTLELRRWQKEAIQDALRHYLQNQETDYFSEICPASGKSIFSLSLAKQLLQRNDIKKIVVVVHTDSLRCQWIREAKRFSWVFAPVSDYFHKSYKENPPFDGLVVSYQQVCNLAERLRDTLGGPHKALIIFDEVHHVADEYSFGKSVTTAFENAWRRLEITGTPFREDDNNLVFAPIENGLVKPHYYYSYADALADGIVAPVFFPSYGGTTRWQVDSEEFEFEFDDATTSEQIAAQQLNTALNSADWLTTVIQDAHDRLIAIREQQPDAGGLIVCRDQDHARMIAGLLESIIGQEPVMVISDVLESQALIDSFRGSTTPWIVAVKMISEGIDIPRLRVGVYATNIKTELFFRQILGRFLRISRDADGHPLEDQSVFLYIPRHRKLVEFARDIARQRQHIVRPAKKRSAQREGGEQVPSTYQPLDAIAEASTVLTPYGELTAEDIRAAQRLKTLGKLQASVEMLAAILKQQRQQTLSQSASRRQTP